ncbi:MAG: FixH family protein [Desulfovibrio sp.]|jgi:hypothetical protein|nr:FixH family protein [Desulfovibrio sp.]
MPMRRAGEPGGRRKSDKPGEMGMHYRKFLIFCLLCLTVAVFPDVQAEAADQAHPPAIIVENKSYGLTWTLTTPAKPGVVQVSLRLRDAGGNPVSGRVVTGEVWMPGMPMEGYPLELRFEEAEGGLYLALVQYGHGGHWQIRAAFRGGDDQVLRQSFDFEIGH